MESKLQNVMVDMTGLRCPAPLLGVKQLVDDLAHGEILLVVSDCAGTKDDLLTWAKYTDNEVVRIDDSHPGGTRIYLRKGKPAGYVVNVTLDVRGAICPGPVIEAHRILLGMQEGEVLKLISNCSASHDEVGSWTAATGHELLDTRQTDRNTKEFYVRKR